MLRWKHITAGCFILSLAVGDVFGAARLEPLTVGYSNFTGAYAPLWIAAEEHVGVDTANKDRVTRKNNGMRIGINLAM